MPNAKYISGRAFEYETMREFKKLGYETFRTAGSHGLFDVIAVKRDCPTLLIQCKRTSDLATAERLKRSFANAPPMGFRQVEFAHYVQVLLVKVKGQKSLVEEWVG